MNKVIILKLAVPYLVFNLSRNNAFHSHFSDLISSKKMIISELDFPDWFSLDSVLTYSVLPDSVFLYEN